MHFICGPIKLPPQAPGTILLKGRGPTSWTCVPVEGRTLLSRDGPSKPGPGHSAPRSGPMPRPAAAPGRSPPEAIQRHRTPAQASRARWKGLRRRPLHLSPNPSPYDRTRLVSRLRWPPGLNRRLSLTDRCSGSEGKARDGTSASERQWGGRTRWRLSAGRGPPVGHAPNPN
jgi:hypothetical protein